MAKIRKIYQLIFLSFTFFIFTADTAITQAVIGFFHSLHIFPALNSAFGGSGARYMAFTLIFLIATAVFGRFYCSFLCPLGFLQDILSSIARIFKIKPGRVHNIWWLRTFILFLTIFAAIFGTGFWGWLDHFSIFGRLINGFVIPAANYTLSPLAPYLNKTNYLQIEGLDAHFSGFDFYYSLIFITALFIISAFRPRWFCNTLCPSGALFALIYKAGFLKIQLSKNCPGCKRCEKICPSASITNGEIDYATCVTCFECVRVCPSNILKISVGKNKNDAATAYIQTAPGTPADNKQNIASDRRAFIANMASVSAAVCAANYLAKPAMSLINIKKIGASMPPGAINAHNFFSKCSACHLCISNCPSKVLKPALLENGITGISKPRLDYDKSYCAYECNVCTGVCPSGALKYLPLKEKQITAIGTVFLDTTAKTHCIPYKDKVDCGSCAEHCPTGAVYMVKNGDVFVPKIRRAYCNGCGICEHVCPVLENKPIKVMPLAKQPKIRRLADVQAAQKPSAESSGSTSKNADANSKANTSNNANPADSKNDFPF